MNRTKVKAGTDGVLRFSVFVFTGSQHVNTNHDPHIS